MKSGRKLKDQWTDERNISNRNKNENAVQINNRHSSSIEDIHQFEVVLEQ